MAGWIFGTGSRFELPPEEHELVSKAIAKAARKLERSLGAGAFVEPKDALLYMSKRLLETDLAGDPATEGGPAATSGARVECEDSLFTILP